MAKKHFGRLLTLAAVVGAAAAGVSYFLQYKSFHKELNEDFHDFEDDFDDFDDTEDKDSRETARSYVTLTPEHKPEEKEEPAMPPEEDKTEAVPEEGTAEDTAEDTETEDAPAKEIPAEAEAQEAPADEKESIPETTVTVEEVTE